MSFTHTFSTTLTMSRRPTKLQLSRKTKKNKCLSTSPAAEDATATATASAAADVAAECAVAAVSAAVTAVTHRCCIGASCRPCRCYR